jgi:hypothetical protein
MPVSDYFTASYLAARDRFLVAARAAGAGVASYEMPERRGPGGESLAVDVATLGPVDAESALVLLSGTHGVEGFCGSGCQVGFLVDRLHDALPARTRSVLVHALNPHGFAWLRRVNEDNVDLNRNFRDFSQPLPDSSAYEEVNEALVPEDWNGQGRKAADGFINNYIAERGLAAFQAAVQGGQYTRPTGLFYGGTVVTWSNRTLRTILQEHVPARVKRLASIDIHTGLGPAGYGEPIYIGPDDANWQRVVRWFGPEVTNPGLGKSITATVSGSTLGVFLEAFPDAEVTPIGLEFGTVPLMQVLEALRADHWMHAAPGRETTWRQAFERQMREAFYVDTPAWKAGVYGRTSDFVLRAGRGMAGA